MAGRTCISLFTFLAVLICAEANNVFVVAPNTFRLSVDETVGIFVAQGSQEVNVYLQDLPGLIKTFSKMTVTVSANNPKVIKMRINPEDIPDLAKAKPETKHYVKLVVESTKGANFKKEVNVLVGLRSGYVFVQTDKPIYKPKETVLIRVIPLDQEMVSDNKTFTIQIRNPQNVIVDSNPSSKLNNNRGLFSYSFELPPSPMQGEWSVVVFYNQNGKTVPQNETVTFELKSYTLPTFSVKLDIPEVILPSVETIQAEVEAKYVYGKMVEGSVHCKFGVMSDTLKIIYVGRTIIKLLEDGKALCEVSNSTFVNNTQVGWFPKISGNRLVVEAVVVEKATGEREKVTSSNTIFTNKKYLVSFKRSLRDFRPGLNTIVMAEITEALGRKAPNVDVQIEVKNQHQQIVALDNWSDRSDENGRVFFIVPTLQSYNRLHIKIITNDADVNPIYQGVGTHEMVASSPGNFIALDRTPLRNTLVVGKLFSSNLYSIPEGLDISYVVTSGGHVVSLGTVSRLGTKQSTLQFPITDQMVPSVRITLFAFNGGHILSDSVKVDVQNECRDQAKINIETSFKNSRPGEAGKIEVKGTSGTILGVLAIDKAVYVLRNKGLLTKDKMFSRMEEQDLGCGAGGGQSTAHILANAGLIFISDSSINTPERPSCSERKLRKREIREETLHEEDEELYHCCTLGMYPDMFNRPCDERAQILKDYHPENNCSETFLRCCLKTEHLHKNSNAMAARAGQLDEDLSEVQDELEDDKSIPERKDFRETWLFETGLIGSDNRLELKLNIPHSITTWVIQAVGLNPEQGMCVADPIETTTFQNLFIQLNLPYSVVRHEQIEIRATIFNYEKVPLTVVVYMYGAEGLCSEAQPNEKGERKRIKVAGNGGAETVAFSVVPLQTGFIPIQVVAQSPRGSDKIIKMLNVIAEGTTVEEDILLDIDPSNLAQRKKRDIEVPGQYTTRIDPGKKRQFSEVFLTPKQEYIPSTESCYITAIGDKFGTIIHTVLTNPDQLLRMPTGCGEQNMAYLAPTLYTLHYLKVTEKMTAQQEENGYRFIREGYKRELTFRKPDGSYAVFPNVESSTWLTTFVAKIFCQASKYVYIDQNVICSALDWLAKQQDATGAFIERKPLIHQDMTGGINGALPLTAFVLNAMYKCDCNGVDLGVAKEKALGYLINALPGIRDPYILAIVTYALSLADPAEAGQDANQRLMAISTFNEELNQRYWGQPGTPLSVEASSYALLTQMIYGNKDIASSIVNWLNTQKTTTGAFWSTQDTVIALEALAEYAIHENDPEMNLSCNLTSTSDIKFKETLQFTPENARVLRSYEISKLGGKLQLEAQGTGVSKLAVKLKYNVPENKNEICKFDISINVTEAKPEEKPKKKDPHVPQKPEDFFDRGLLNQMGYNPDDKGNFDVDPRQQFQRVGDMLKLPRFTRDIAGPDEKLSSTTYVANFSICAKYLWHADSGMAIIDVGLFTGYRPLRHDLSRLVNDSTLSIDRYEEAGRSLIFYLDKISHTEPVCFWFRAKREFLVDYLQSSIVKVYDYYNPSHRCTVYFSPSQISAKIHTKCNDKKVCKCAEGGCPPGKPFQKILNYKRSDLRYSALLELACDEHDFVWKVKVEDIHANKTTSFQKIDFQIINILKEGREKRNADLDQKRTFIGSRLCNSTNFVKGKTYIIMGTDYEPFQETNGQLRYMYYLNKKTTVYEWFNLNDLQLQKSAAEKNLQKVFMSLVRQFLKEGCVQ